ncbi:hypothetical protein FEE95_02710 [Maribacter algarum]|uniref:Uncharacterized protein n=1 Tax=Maribacter algarum (ex Zhang et al. 2020) TaxID=2578118 RepID=A0A5S3PTM9_9FLAO|nr:hypothetical protein [Maribacter algarum]TMM58359.1 hypothetical protein FEE95_02710 [Maribacter algarum]
MIKNLLSNSQMHVKKIIENLKKILKPSFLNTLDKSFNLSFRNGNSSLEEVPNLSYIKELSNADIDFQNKFLRTFMEEFTSELKAYQFCIDMGAPRAAAGKVAKLKDKLNILGMKNAFRFAERHQRKLQKGNKSSDGQFKKILAKGNRFLANQLQVYELIN